MSNRIPYLIIIALIFCKVFAWWLLFWGSNITEGEVTLIDSFSPIHQFSYLILTSFLAVGLLFKSKFAYYSLFAAFAINLGIFLLNGHVVYQSALDPVLIILLGLVVYYKQPNSWLGLARANKQINKD